MLQLARTARLWLAALALCSLPCIAPAQSEGMPSPTPLPTFPDAPIGFASVNSLGQNGTTGGAGGPTVTVTTGFDFGRAAAQPGPLVIRVDGMIALTETVDVASDKTILGVGAHSGFTNGGLFIGKRNTNETFPPDAIKNVIVRNLVLTQCPDDCINIQEFSHHVWIDHNDLSLQTDGALDIKRGSDFVTVSWNRFHDSDKNSLLGHSDNNASQDVGRLRVTYHNNWFDGTVQRNPRVRFAEPVHVFNNYYLNVTLYGVASQDDAGVVVEGNFFENSRLPTRNDVGGDPGRLVERLNMFVNSDPPFSVGTVMEPSQFYDYTLMDAADVPAAVRQGAGVGKLGL